MLAYPVFTVARVGVLLFTIDKVGLEGVQHGPDRDQQFDHLKASNRTDLVTCTTQRAAVGPPVTKEQDRYW